jgi:hypothetical protein
MFENKNYEGIYYSRFVASYCRSGGSLENRKCWLFKEWLEQLIINEKPIPQDIVKEIYDYGINGKMELEFDAYEFLKNRK